MGALIPRTSARYACETSKATTSLRTRSPSGSPYHSRCNAMFRWTILWSSTAELAPLHHADRHIAGLCRYLLRSGRPLGRNRQGLRIRTRSYVARKSPTQDLSRARHVVGYVPDEFLGGGERDLPPEPSHEVEGHLLSVKVGVEVEHERFHGPFPTGEGRVGPHGHGRRQRLLITPLADEPACVHPVGGHGGERRQGQVRRGETEFTATTFAAHDDALQPVRTAECLGRCHHVTGIDARSHVGGRVRDLGAATVLRHGVALQRRLVRGESEPLAE